MKTSDSYVSGPMGAHGTVLEALEYFADGLRRNKQDDGKAAAIDYLAFFANARLAQHPDQPSLYQMPVFSLLWALIYPAHAKDTQVSDLYKQAALTLEDSVLEFARSRVCFFLLSITLSQTSVFVLVSDCFLFLFFSTEFCVKLGGLAAQNQDTVGQDAAAHEGARGVAVLDANEQGYGASGHERRV